MLADLLNKRDFHSGWLLAVLGAAVARQAKSYDVGTLTHMGPGMFPVILGVVLICLGIAILVSAVLTPRAHDEYILPVRREWLGWSCILAGPIMFIVGGSYLGMAPATFLCVFVSAMGDRTATLRSSATLALGITVVGCLLFYYLLHIPFALFRWGF